MFGFSRGKVDYEKIFISTNETYEYIYGDKSKTAEILGDEKFIEAWLDSKNIASISGLIKNEALKGNIPSLKQMIWLSDLYFNDADNLPINENQKLEIKIASLKGRIMFCEKAIEFGLDQSYNAKISCANLYLILTKQLKTDISDKSTINALNGIVKHAKSFINSDYNDAELIKDAKKLLEQYAPLAQLINSLR